MDVFYKRKEKKKSYLTVRNGTQKLHAIFVPKDEFMEVQIDWYHAIYEDEEMDVIPFLEAIVEKAKERAMEYSAEMLYFPLKRLPRKLKTKDAVEQYFKENWEELGERKEDLDCFREKRHPFLDHNYFVLFAQDKTIKQMFDLLDSTIEVIKEKEKEDITIEFVFRNDRTYMLKQKEYFLYYQGKECHLTFKLHDWSTIYLNIVSNEGEIFSKRFSLPFFDKETWMKEWKEEFNRLYNKQRLKNLFNPMNRHTALVLRDLAENKRGENLIKEYLLKQYSPLELELLCATTRKNHLLYFRKSDEERSRYVSISCMEKHIFVLHHQNAAEKKLYSFTWDEKDKAMQTYETLRIQIYQELLKKEMKFTKDILERMSKRRENDH